MQGPLPVLMGRRVLLREPREDDGAALFRYTSDPEVTRFLAMEPPGSLDDTLRVWDLTTGCCVRTIEGHRGDVLSVSLSADGRYGLSGSGP